MRITDEQVVTIALEMSSTVAPTTDLIARVAWKLKVSRNMAGNAVGRVLSKNLIEQVWTEEMRYSPTSAGNKGDPFWKTGVAIWQRKMMGDPGETDADNARS